MSRLLRQLLDESEPLFSHYLARLEKASGAPGIDARLTADILSASAGKVCELGLDPKDTTGNELFSSLIARAEQGDDAMRSYLGHPASMDDATAKSSVFIRNVMPSHTTWALKGATVKKILSKNPPKQVMKAFHYQSIDSMLKRMDVKEILLAARIVENKTWSLKYRKLLSQCYTRDFGKSTVDLIALTDARWLPLIELWRRSKGCTVVASKEVAAVGFMMRTEKGSFIHTLPLVLHAINEASLHGSFLKLHYVHPSIGTALVDAIDEGSVIHTSLSGLTVHWRDVQRYYGSLLSSEEPVFTHLDVTDLGWLQTETLLAMHVPDLSFWIGTDYLGISFGENRILSLNIHDVAESLVFALNHTDMATSKMKRALRSELMARYLEHPSARAVALKQFDISAITDENW